MVKLSHFIILCCVLPLQWLRAADLSRMTLTEVVADVTIIDPGSKAIRPARVNDAFAAPQLLRTGRSSRAEILAEDQTLTRIGANSLFSFVPGQRQINLQRGSVLFNSPAGRGGGTIKTASVSCSVLGTTLIVVATEEGGLKVLLLEGRGKVTNAKGDTLHLSAGQMTCLLPGQQFGPPINFRIPDQVRSSKLVSGFHTSLKSLPKIEAASRNQDRQMARGEMRLANSGDPGEQGPPGQGGPPPAGGPGSHGRQPGLALPGGPGGAGGLGGPGPAQTNQGIPGLMKPNNTPTNGQRPIYGGPPQKPPSGRRDPDPGFPTRPAPPHVAP